MRNDKPSVFARAMSRTKSVPHSVHLSKLSEPQLHALRDKLIFEYDAHRAMTFESHPRAVGIEMRKYLAAVKLEILCRVPLHKRNGGRAEKSRYETRRPTSILKRVINKQSGGSVSLADLQAEYGRLK